MSNKNIPFPQADSFEKIIKILNINDEEQLKDKGYLSKLLGDVHARQVAYYLSASMYLDIVNLNKEFTEYARTLRAMSKIDQQAELALKIVSDPVFGKTFFMFRMLKDDLEIEDVIKIMKEKNIVFESKEMYKRRAQTVISWVKWINKIVD